jgi:hypothetical protein
MLEYEMEEQCEENVPECTRKSDTTQNRFRAAVLRGVNRLSLHRCARTHICHAVNENERTRRDRRDMS